jgi:hypothetical protein
MAQAAGRYARQLDPVIMKQRPYLQFIHSDADIPRPHHKALDGMVFRADQIPFPVPNGFGCGCRYVSLSEDDLREQGLTVSNLKRGDTVGTVKLEPDPGFDYIPGQTSVERRTQLLKDAVSRLPIEHQTKIIGEALKRAGLK